MRKSAPAIPTSGIQPYDVVSWSLGYDDVAHRYKVVMIRSYEATGGCRRYEALVSAFGDNHHDTDYDPWNIVEFHGNYSLGACQVATRRKFIWLVFSKSKTYSDKDDDRRHQCLEPGLMWSDMSRGDQDAAGQEVMNLRGGVLPKLWKFFDHLDVHYFKVYAANGNLCFLGLNDCARYNRFEIWETENWDRMSHWSRVHVISVHHDLSQHLLIPIWIMALEIMDNQARRTDPFCISDDHHDRGREYCRRLYDWLSSLESIARYYCDYTVIQRDSLINLARRKFIWPVLSKPTTDSEEGNELGLIWFDMTQEGDDEAVQLEMFRKGGELARMTWYQAPRFQNMFKMYEANDSLNFLCY
ncbi:hypothetical protein Droror1_Dr00008258 [Drosera rotundifolia]